MKQAFEEWLEQQTAEGYKIRESFDRNELAAAKYVWEVAWKTALQQPVPKNPGKW